MSISTFNFLSALLLALVALVSAAPAAQMTYGYQGMDFAYCTEASFKGSCAYWTSGPGGRFPNANIFKEDACTTLKAFDKKITSYTVEGGCCGFYAGDKCETLLWSTNNNKASSLAEDKNNKAESWKCARACQEL